MAARRFRSDDDRVDRLYEDTANADLQPLWQQRGLLPSVPNGLGPQVWRWKTLRDLAERSGQLIGIHQGGDRRVLALSHPDLGGLPFATHTLWGGIQYLNPGEVAPAHRHSPAALRLVLEGKGVWTMVNGDALLMEPGDLVLTPSYNWHEHQNPGDEPMIWFDGLDLPLVRNLDAVFFENGPDEPAPLERTSRSRSEIRFAAGGVVPVFPGPAADDVQAPASGLHSPLLRYPWADVDRALAGLLGRTNAGRAEVRYVDPATGRDIMPTLRAEMLRIRPGGRTSRRRTVGSAIVVVRSGSGVSTINDEHFDWGMGDMFVVPSWAAVDHRSLEGADLFVLSDGPVIEAAGLGRREMVEAP